MNLTDIENAKRIVEILKGIGPHPIGHEYSHLNRLYYLNWITIVFGDYSNAFHLMDGQILYNRILSNRKPVNMDNVQSIILKQCISPPRQSDRISELSELFFDVMPLLFNKHGILVMDTCMINAKRDRFTLHLSFTDNDGSNHLLWDADSTEHISLKQMVKNLDAHIHAKKIAIAHDRINNF